MTKLVITFTDDNDYNARIGKYDDAAGRHFGGNKDAKTTKKPSEKKLEMDFADMDEVMAYIKQV